MNTLLNIFFFQGFPAQFLFDYMKDIISNLSTKK